MNDKPLPIGTDDFKKLITNGFYYVDKTLLIKELLDKKSEVNLFTRPRRFGKTLNISMLRYFFEDTGDIEVNQENQKLFTETKIFNAGNKYLSEMNRYPVISLSLKSAKQPSWELAYACLTETIGNEFLRHRRIMPSIVTDADKKRFQDIQERNGDVKDYVTSLAFLSRLLMEHYQKPVIILVDEYDVPLENAYFAGFYQEMVDFIRSLFESALKTNPSLHFSVITGCLRITKESIFTGLNNLESISIMDKNYDEYFGFTPNDIDQILQDYRISSKKELLCQWYDGYSFGNTDIYNPWSIINYVKDLLSDKDAPPRPYWSNTSSNSIIRSLIEKADASVRAEIEDLIAGNSIEKPVHEDITYEDVYDSMDNLWNFLFFTGYLTKTGQIFRDDEIYVSLRIPNKEVRQIYKTKITGWFREEIGQKDLSTVYRDMLEGNETGFQVGLTELLQDTISFYDNAESFYHGFMIGMLGHLRTHIVKSNREAGDGRYDISIRSLDITKPIIIMEIKTAAEYKALEYQVNEALKQIQQKEYDREFAQEGYQKSIRYGIAFYKKTCRVKKEEVDL